MTDDTPDLATFETEAAAQFEAKVGEFLAWLARYWGMRDETAEAEGKPKSWAEGWDAAVESLPGAFECWREVDQ